MPGAITIRSGNRRMPSSATSASRPAAADSWRANTAMNGAGRCWVTRIGAPILRRQFLEEVGSAWMPPVEAPSASNLTGPSFMARIAPTRSAVLPPGRARCPVMSARPSARSLPSRTSEKRPLKRPVPGLGKVSAAPSASAATVSSAPFLGQRGDDQHLGAARGLEDRGDGLQAARARHFEVEQDDVDPDLAERVDGVLGGARRRRRSRIRRRLRSCATGTARATIESSTIISRMRRRVQWPRIAPGPHRGERRRPSSRLRRRRRAAA